MKTFHQPTSPPLLWKLIPFHRICLHQSTQQVTPTPIWRNNNFSTATWWNRHYRVSLTLLHWTPMRALRVGNRYMQQLWSSGPINSHLSAQSNGTPPMGPKSVQTSTGPQDFQTTQVSQGHFGSNSGQYNKMVTLAQANPLLSPIFSNYWGPSPLKGPHPQSALSKSLNRSSLPLSF